MTALSSSLLEFILGLLSNEDDLRKFDSNPEKFMADAGYGGCEGEVADYRKMVDDYKPATHAKADSSPSAKADHGHADYQVVKHVTEKHDHHYGPTSHHENNMYGDTYDVWAEDSTFALPGGVAIGEDAEVKHSTIEAQANRVQNSGDGSQVAGDDAVAVDSFHNAGNDFGGGANLLEAGDGDQVGNNAAADGSTANSGIIDHSKVEVGDVDVDVNAVVGNSNDTQQQSEDAEQENEGLLVIDNPSADLGGGFPLPLDAAPAG